MRRNRRMVLIDRIIPFLAALVGLVALAGAVVVQMQVSTQNEAIRAELAQARNAMDLLVQRNDTLSQRLDAVGEPRDDGVAEALLALQDRMVKLEAAATAAPLSAPAPLATEGANEAAARPIDPNLPTTDCIPLGTRFMVTPGDSFPICQSKVVITAAAITGDVVALDNGTTITETGISPIAGTNCTAAVLSAEVEGFAEMRVDCQ